MNATDFVVSLETFLLFLVNISPLMLAYRLLFFMGISITRGCKLLFTFEFQTGNADQPARVEDTVHKAAHGKNNTTDTYQNFNDIKEEEAPSGTKSRANVENTLPTQASQQCGFTQNLKMNHELTAKTGLVESAQIPLPPSQTIKLSETKIQAPPCPCPSPPPPPVPQVSRPVAPPPACHSLPPGVPPPPPPPPGPPPPPPPPPGLNRSCSNMPQRRCKKLSWKALSTTQENTIWRKINAKLSTLNNLVDEDDVLEKFTDDKTKAKAASVDSMKPKQVKPCILEEKKSLNLAIALAHAGITITRLIKALEDMDGTQVSGDFFQTVYPFLPSTKEISVVNEKLDVQKLLKSKDKKLTSPEEFALVISTVKDHKKRIRGLVFQHCFQERMGNLETNMSLIYKAACEVTSSPRLEWILMYVLSTGNIMNGSTTLGFGLELLTKIGDIKTPDRSTSVLMYIVTQICKKQSDMINLKDDLPNLDNTTKVTSEEIDRSFSELAAEFLAVEKDTAAIVNASETYKEFLQFAKKEMTALKKMRKETNNALKDMVTYLGENPATIKPRDIFNILRQFIADVGSTIECIERRHRRRMQELKRKSAAKSAPAKSARSEDADKKAGRWSWRKN